MSLVDSLLGAIVRLDGDALVMHVGEKPYVVTTSSSLDAFRGPLAWGQVELATRRLTVEAVSGMLQQLLPDGERQTLTDFGAIEYELKPVEAVPGRFTVIAARGGDDIWLEIRYRRPPRPQAVFEPAAPPVEPAAAEAPPAAVEAPPVETLPVPAPVVETPPEAQPEAAPEPVSAEPIAEPAPPVEVVAPAAAAQIAVEPVEMVVTSVPEPAPEVASAPEPLIAAAEPAIPPVAEPEAAAIVVATPEAHEALPTIEIPATAEAVTELASQAPAMASREVAADDEGVYDLSSALASLEVEEEEAAPAEVAAAQIEPAPGPIVEAAPEPIAVAPELEAVPLESIEEPAPAVVVPLARPAVRVEAPARPLVHRSPLDRLLRLAAARGASALFIAAEAHPVIRVEGEIHVLEAEEPLGAADVAAMLMELAPEPTRDALSSGAVTEWIRDIADVGRVRCVSFRDHRGPGGLFRMLPARALSVEQLGLSRTIQALCKESEGLVLVTGPRASGKTTLVSAFVDLINRARADHVITLESQIVFVHESRRSFVSQRELRGTSEDLVAAARAALREDPDVLVIEDLRSAGLASVGLEASESGRLVFGALSAAGATAAIERVIDQFTAERRSQVQTSLAGTLRAVVAQVLLRKIGGGRVAAREVLINTRPVAALIAEGRTSELAHAIESGRKLGCVPLNDALVGFVRSGAVDPAEAYRKAYDRDGLLAQLRRDGVDTSFVERLA